MRAIITKDSEAQYLTIAKNRVELLGDSDKGRPAAQLLQFSGSDVSAGGADASQDVPHRLLHRSFEGDLHCLPL